MPAQVLATARQQLTYWQTERAAADQLHDEERVARCERFIKQCETVIAALEQSHATHVPRAPKPDDFFN